MVLNCEIVFQDLEEVLNSAKMCIKYGNSKLNHLFIQILFFTAGDSSPNVFALCSKSKIFEK